MEFLTFVFIFLHILFRLSHFLLQNIEKSTLLYVCRHCNRIFMPTKATTYLATLNSQQHLNQDGRKQTNRSTANRSTPVRMRMQGGWRGYLGHNH